MLYHLLLCVRACDTAQKNDDACVFVPLLDILREGADPKIGHEARELVDFFSHKNHKI